MSLGSNGLLAHAVVKGKLRGNNTARLASFLCSYQVSPIGRVACRIGAGDEAVYYILRRGSISNAAQNCMIFKRISSRTA